jgi:sulfur carrier protein ThiS
LNIVETKKKEVIKMKLRIMNEKGHTELDVTTSEMIEQIAEHQTHWVYVDNDMVSRESINDINWNEVETVNLVQAIVGGNQ